MARKPGYGNANPASWVFYKALTPLGPAKYKLHQRLQCHRYLKTAPGKGQPLASGCAAPWTPSCTLTHRNLLLPQVLHSFSYMPVHRFSCMSVQLRDY